MIITATFTGQNGSLGYKTHKEYKLKLQHTAKRNIRIEDMSKHPAQDCEYSNMLTFLQNWKNVKDVTSEQPKRDPKEVVCNFIDFCKAKPMAQIERAMKFYKKPFNPREVMQYFQNWSMAKTNKYRDGIILTNINTETEKTWKVKVWINDNSEYSFCSGSEEEPENWQYIPKTMSDFISDCLRYDDVELLFSKKAIKEIYGC